MPVFGIEERLGHREVRAGFHFGVEARDFIVEIVCNRVQRDADGEIRLAAERFPRPIRALVQTIQDFYQANGIHFVHAAGFRIIADGRRIASNREDVAHTADGPRAQKHGLQADDVLIARGEVRHGLDAPGFQSAGDNERVHAHASHRAAIDVDGVHLFGSHYFVNLLVDAIERKALGRIDLHANGEFLFLQFFPELALRFPLLYRHRVFHGFHDRRGVSFPGMQRFHRFGHGADVRGRGATTPAKNAHAEFGGFPGELRKVFGRRLRIDDAVAFALGKAGVGHAADADIPYVGEFLENGEKRLRAQGAVGANHLDVFIFQHRRGEEWPHIAVRGALLRVGELRDDGQAGEGADGINRQQQFFDIGKRFEDEKIDAPLLKGQRLLVKNGKNEIGLGMARLHADAERPDGAGDKDLARRGFPRFAGDLHAAAVQALHVVAEAEGSELEAVRPEGVGFDDLRARFDVALVDTENRFRLGGVEFVKAAYRSHGFVQHGAHRAVRNENRILQPFVEILNLHESCVLFNEIVVRAIRSAFLFHQAGDGAHQIILGEYLELRFFHFHEDRGVLVAQNIGDAFDGSRLGNQRQRLAHHFAHDEFAQVFALQRQGQNLVFIHGADEHIFLKNGDLRNILFLHGFQRVENGLVGPGNHQLADLAGSPFGGDDFRGSDRHARFGVAALAHPLVIEYLAEVAHAGIRQQRNDVVLWAQILGEPQRGGKASAAGAAGEQSFELGQAARHDEAFFIIHLDHVVQNLHVHRGGKEILADAFHNVSPRFGDFSSFVEIVKERALRIHADDSNLGVLLLEKFADADPEGSLFYDFHKTGKVTK